MGCSAKGIKACNATEKKQTTKKTSILQFLKAGEQWGIAPKIMSYLNLIEIGKVSRVCRYFHAITGNKNVLRQYQTNKTDPSDHSISDKYTYTNVSSVPTPHDYDMITDKECKAEQVLFTHYQPSDECNLMTPKFVSNPPTLNDTIKREIKMIEFEYEAYRKNQKDIDIPGHIFSVTDSLENPNAYIGIENMIRQKSTRKMCPKLSLSGI